MLLLSIGNLVQATKISTGLTHSCALLSDGSIRCWGESNSNGELGNGQTTTSYWDNPVVVVSGITEATSISCGGSFSCAVLTDGGVKCWGGIVDSSTPVSVIGITAATGIASGDGHACALLTGGMIKCWGYNSNGQLGDGTITDRSSPASVWYLNSGVY